jgi:hypothetical protein
MEQLLGREEDLDQRHWDDAVVKFKDARRDFHQAARIDMGVVGAPPKDMSWDLVIGQIQDTDGLACARPVPDLPVNKG